MITAFQKLTNTQKNCLALAVFSLLVALFYGNTLQNGFIYDDFQQIVENEFVHSFQYLPDIATSCAFKNMIINCQNAAYYRPTQNFSYLLTWQVSSSPWLFHLVNLVYFLAAVFLVFILIKKLTSKPLLSFLTALFFLIHPINSEVANWPAAVPELLFAVFVLLSAIYFINYRETSFYKNLFFSVLFYFLAILSKEPAILLPAIFILLDWRVFNIKLVGLSKERTKRVFRINWRELKTYSLFLIPLTITFLMRFAVLGRIVGLPQGHLDSVSAPERIFSFFVLFKQYLAKLLNPHPLQFFYSFEKDAKFFNPQFIISFFVAILFFAAIGYLLKKKLNLPAVFLAWIFVFLIPAIFFIEYAGESVFAERYLFLPSIGFAFILAYILNRFWEKKRNLRFCLSLLLLIILITAGSWLVVFPRNKTFLNNQIFYSETLRFNPVAQTIRWNRGIDFMNTGGCERAIADFKKLLEINPLGWGKMIFNQMGVCYRRLGEFDLAAEYYQKSVVASGGKNLVPYNNLAVLYMEDKKDYIKAASYLCRALKLAPESQEIENNFNLLADLMGHVASGKDLQKLYCK